jgi:hypothetical protein
MIGLHWRENDGVLDKRRNQLMITATRINDNLVLYIQDAMKEVALELDRTATDRKAWAFAQAAQQKHGLTLAETYDLYRTILIGGY